MEAKRLAAEKAVEYVHDNMIVGLGTGSTSFWAIKKISEEIKKGLKIKAVASSTYSEELARELNIPIIPLSKVNHIDITIDGADEVDKNYNLIKGGGGALLREKILAFHSQQFVVIVDESKMVENLGKFPLPVEVLPFGAELTLTYLEKLGCKASIRMEKDNFYISDNGNYIADCYFQKIKDPENLNVLIHKIPGVVETGIFLRNMVAKVIVGYKNGTVKEFHPVTLP